MAKCADHFRVLKPFPWKRHHRKPAILVTAGKVVNIPTIAEANQLMAQGLIEPLQIAFANANARFQPLGPRQKGLRVGIWLMTSGYYSGGRVHLFQYAWNLADAGAEVFLVTNSHPRWASDYPQIKRIHVVIEDKSEPPEDLDLIVTDSKGNVGMGSMHYRRAHPHVALAVLNFETPNFVAKFDEKYATKLGLSQRNKVAFEDCDLLMANSEESLRHCKEWVGLDARYQHEAALWPAVNEFALRASETADLPGGVGLPRRPYAVYSARPVAYKGFDVVVDAVWSLDVPFDLAIFGQAKNAPKDTELHRMHSYDGQPDRVKFALMRGATVTLSPSRFEAAGLVPMESLASGTPCVVYHLPVYDELYGDRLIYVDWGDAEMFKATVAEVVRRCA